MTQQVEERPHPPFPAQEQEPPGSEAAMMPRPAAEKNGHRGTGKLLGKVAIITGGDSGIGRAVAIAFAREGADITISYLNEHEDAQETVRQVEQEGRRCLAIAGDIGDAAHCRGIVQETLQRYERVDILVNNAAEQHPAEDIEQIEPAQLERTFRTNVFSCFYLSQAALPHMEAGSTIINTTSVTAYRGSPHLLDYSSTKGAIVSFTRSLAKGLAERGIRVNAVAPGPIWTPLIVSGSESPEHVAQFGGDVPLKRPGQPEEVAPCYVFLASDDSSYMTGQVLHPNGGEVVNG